MASLSLHMCVCLFALHMLGIKVMPHNWHTFIERDLFKGFTSFDSTGSGCFSTKLHTQVRKFLPRCQKYVKKPNLGRCLAAKSLPSHVESIVAVVVASARARARGGAPAQEVVRGCLTESLDLERHSLRIDLTRLTSVKSNVLLLPLPLFLSEVRSRRKSNVKLSGKVARCFLVHGTKTGIKCTKWTQKARNDQKIFLKIFQMAIKYVNISQSKDF
jgi:hypothetical protein